MKHDTSTQKKAGYNPNPFTKAKMLQYGKAKGYRMQGNSYYAYIAVHGERFIFASTPQENDAVRTRIACEILLGYALPNPDAEDITELRWKANYLVERGYVQDTTTWERFVQCLANGSRGGPSVLIVNS